MVKTAVNRPLMAAGPKSGMTSRCTRQTVTRWLANGNVFAVYKNDAGNSVWVMR